MKLFQIILLYVVAELSCLRHPVVYGEGNPEILSQNTDLQTHRTKRWLWPGCGFIPGCERCNDGLICKKCRHAFIPVEYRRTKNTILIRCVRSCPLGYNITSTAEYSKICVRTQLGCAVRSCNDCFPHNPVSCANCTLGYYSLQKRIMGNVKCVRQCPAGFTPTIKKDGKEICKDTQSKCQSIVPNCAKCLDSVRCRKCREDLNAFFNKSGMVCVPRCPKGFVSANSSYFGNYCKKPLVECQSVLNCERCPDKINCRRCKPRYLRLKTSAFANSTCVTSCPPGFGRKGRRCQRVTEAGCFDEHCLTCKEGWYRLNYNKRHCQRKCPRGFFILGTKQKFCLRCLPNCEECVNGFDCNKCKPGTSKFTQRVHTSCVTNCPFGYSNHRNAETGSVCLLNRVT